MVRQEGESVAHAPAPWGAGPTEKLLSRAEAARYLGLPVSTIYHWAKIGRLPYRVTLGGHLRFARADLDDAYVTSVRYPREEEQKAR